MWDLQLANCLWLIVPVLLWNWAFASRLPAAYSSDARVPQLALHLETVLRIAVLGLPVLLPLRLGDLHSRLGWLLYAVGLLCYFASWMMQMGHQDTGWSRSAFGVLAPAYTPLIWLAGIALIGRSAGYFWLALAFTVIHTWHNVWVFGYR
jgi:hypothetical protein